VGEAVGTRRTICRFTGESGQTPRRSEGDSNPRSPRLGAFDLNANGSLARQSDRVFADLGGPEPGVPDGMKVDTEGNVYCGGAGGIWIMDPKGKKLGRIVHGAPATTNISFGGDDWKTLYFTSRNHLGAVNVKIRGIPVPVAKIAARLCPGGWSRHTAARIERKVYFRTADFFGGAVFFRGALFGIGGLRASLTALPAWNRTALLAAIWMASPVCGFRP